MPFGDLSQALAALAVLLDRKVVQDQRSTADLLAFQPCAPHAGADPLDYEAAFKLCNRANDDNDGPAQRALGEAAGAEAPSVSSLLIHK